MADAFYTDERPHPMGLLENPEWAMSRRVRAELYLAERERRNAPVREYRRPSFLLVLAAVGVAVALFSAWVL